MLGHKTSSRLLSLLGLLLCLALAWPAEALTPGTKALPILLTKKSASFVGPLDSLPTTTAAFSLRRLLSSYTANKAVHVTCSGGTATSGDVGFTTGGDFDTAGYNTHLGTGSCKIDTVYDQSGSGNNLVQATGADQPSITLSATNGKAVVTSSGSPIVLQASFTQSVPAGIYGVAERTGSTTLYNAIIGGGGAFFGFANAANKFQVFFQTGSSQISASDNAYHLVQFTTDNSGSAGLIIIDNSSTSGQSTGTGPLGPTVQLFNDNSGHPLVGSIAEVVVFGSQPSGTNNTNYYNNAHAYYGTP